MKRSTRCLQEGVPLFGVQIGRFLLRIGDLVDEWEFGYANEDEDEDEYDNEDDEEDDGGV